MGFFDWFGRLFLPDGDDSPARVAHDELDMPALVVFTVGDAAYEWKGTLSRQEGRGLDEKTRTCTAYEERPRQCKTWPFWDSNIRTPDAWAEAAEACPGCNKGNLVPLESIVEQASKIRI